VQDVLIQVLHRVREVHKERPDLILAGWKQVVGSGMSQMTEAVSFSEGILVVKVKNSTVHSLLQYEKRRLLQEMRKKFPRTEMKKIVFRVG